jgi:hypothetical protein
MNLAKAPPRQAKGQDGGQFGRIWSFSESGLKVRFDLIDDFFLEPEKFKLE